MGLEMEVIIAYGFGLILLYIVGYGLYKVFSKPLKWIGILLFNGIIGGAVLLLINFVGKFIEFSIAINPLTALVVGFLGIPGVVMIILIKGIL